MKKVLLITAACLAVTLNSKALVDMKVVRSIPCMRPPLLAPIQTATLSTFWVLMTAAFAVDAIAEGTEPADSYECGVQRDFATISASYTWADGDGRYPNRLVEAERTFEFDPRTGIGTWWIKTTSTILWPDGSKDVDITYSSDPPSVIDFTQQDTHYHRVALPGSHDYSFSYDAFEKITAYCYRLASTKCFGRPLICRMEGTNNKAVWTKDILYRQFIGLYTDDHFTYCAFGQIALWQPHVVAGMITEIEPEGRILTLYGNQ